ncbi:MAG: response regulator [Oscillospiraceae bacterium]|jgi:signal transduction histidine kinase/ActR/RegA family two-component response regulator|nr:response regulator [Oscillospiraceae bacterium]
MARREKKSADVTIMREYRDRFEAERLDTNVSRMFGFSIYMVAMQLVLQVVNMAVPQGSLRYGGGGDMPPLVGFYVILSVITLAAGAIYWVLLGLSKRGKIKNNTVKTVLVQSLLYLYLTIQFAFGTCNILSHQGFFSLVILMMMVGMIPILKPLQSLITIGGTFIYTLLLMWFTQDVTLTMGMEIVPLGDTEFSSLIEFFDSDMRANYIIITGVAVLISVFVYRLYVSNFIKSIKLEEINEGLEGIVEERTRELVIKTEAAEAASRAKSRFLTNISHEVRTPLNAIIGMTRYAQKAPSYDETARAIREVANASDHLLGILNDILDMSNIESGEMKIVPERFVLARAVDDVTVIIREHCNEKGIVFKPNIGGLDATAVSGDKLRLRQVLLNLLGNAVKFTPEDGEVGFDVEVVQNADAFMDVAFTIRDSGIGISEEQKKTLFVAFEQGSSNNMKHIGTGLGLAISQSLVKLMGGEITAESKLGEGSTFSFKLRLEKAGVLLDTGAPVVPNLAGKRILSVEDIEINRVILTEILSETSAEVEEAVDGADAVEKFRISPEGYYSFVFMDLLMPNKGGHDAAREIRALPREDAKIVPIVALSANAYPEDVDASVASGMDGHLAKPVDFDEVMRILAEKIGQ